VFGMDTTDTIEGILQGFRPGGCRNCPAPYGLSFTYRITQNVALPSIVSVPYGGCVTIVTLNLALNLFHGLFQGLMLL